MRFATASLLHQQHGHPTTLHALPAELMPLTGELTPALGRPSDVSTGDESKPQKPEPAMFPALLAC